MGGWGWGTVTAGLLLLDSRVHKCGHNADLTLVSVGQLPMVPAHGAQRALTHVPGSPPPRQLSGIVGRQECHVLLFNPMPQSPCLAGKGALWFRARWKAWDSLSLLSLP